MPNVRNMRQMRQFRRWRFCVGHPVIRHFLAQRHSEMREKVGRSEPHPNPHQQRSQAHSADSLQASGRGENAKFRYKNRCFRLENISTV